MAWRITSTFTMPYCWPVFGLSTSAHSQPGSVCMVTKNLCACSGEQAEAYVLFITILLSAKTPAVISTAELDSQLCLGAYDSQQVCHPCSTPVCPHHCQALCSSLVLGAWDAIPPLLLLLRKEEGPLHSGNDSGTATSAIANTSFPAVQFSHMVACQQQLVIAPVGLLPRQSCLNIYLLVMHHLINITTGHHRHTSTTIQPS